MAGLGQRIDTSLMETQLSTMVNVASSYLTTGNDSSKRWGSAHPNIVPYQAFRTSSGQSIVIACGTDEQFRQLCLLLDREDLASEERFRTNKKRVENRAELLNILKIIFLGRTIDFWEVLY